MGGGGGGWEGRLVADLFEIQPLYLKVNNV